MISRNQDLEVIPGRAGVTERRPNHDPSVLGLEEWTFEPGVEWSHGHAHDESQIAYIVKGKLRLDLGGDEVILDAGSYYYTPAGTAHFIREIIETVTMVIVSTPVIAAE
jgi:quercetin dioxygenase-like cupin family protein